MQIALNDCEHVRDGLLGGPGRARQLSERIGGASESIEPCERVCDAVAQLASSGVDQGGDFDVVHAIP